MSDPSSYPPPGWAPPVQPPPPGPPSPTPATGGPGSAQQWAPAPGIPIAAHKPGAVPLRPLGLGDIYDAAFKIIRFNPRATIGAAAVVGVVAMLIPLVASVVVSTAFGVTLGIDTSSTSSSSSTTGDATGFATFIASYAGGAVLLGIGLILLTGMVAGVTHAAATGRRMGLEEAWAATRGLRWRLLGVALLTLVVEVAVVAVAVVLVVVAALAGGPVAGVLVGLVVGVGTVVLLVFAWTRLVLLSTAALVIERLGVFAALGRAWQLSRGAFWRLFGIALLTGLLVGVVSSIIGVPFNIAGEVGAVLSDRWGLVILTAATSIGTVLRSALTSPFSAAVYALLYLDQRMRTEAYEIELLQQAGLLGG